MGGATREGCPSAYFSHSIPNQLHPLEASADKTACDSRDTLRHHCTGSGDGRGRGVREASRPPPPPGRDGHARRQAEAGDGEQSGMRGGDNRQQASRPGPDQVRHRASGATHSRAKCRADVRSALTTPTADRTRRGGEWRCRRAHAARRSRRQGRVRERRSVRRNRACLGVDGSGAAEDARDTEVPGYAPGTRRDTRRIRAGIRARITWDVGGGPRHVSTSTRRVGYECWWQNGWRSYRGSGWGVDALALDPRTDARPAVDQRAKPFSIRRPATDTAAPADRTGDAWRRSSRRFGRGASWCWRGC